MNFVFVYVCSTTPTLESVEPYSALCQATVYGTEAEAMDWLQGEIANIKKMDAEVDVESEFFIGHEFSVPMGRCDVDEEWWLECTTGPMAFDVRVLKKKVY